MRVTNYYLQVFVWSTPEAFAAGNDEYEEDGADMTAHDKDGAVSEALAWLEASGLKYYHANLWSSNNHVGECRIAQFTPEE
jgi:hypothetical protein